MQVLALNCGSSSLKFRLADDSGAVLANGAVERIGSAAETKIDVGAETFTRDDDCPDHAGAAGAIIDWLSDLGHLEPGDIAVGFRVVHGGIHYAEPTLIDATVFDEIGKLTELAPLHNAPAVQAIRAVRAHLDSPPPMVATFDTSFHRTMPEHASQYAIPRDLASRHGIARFGFHGLAHRSMLQGFCRATDTRREHAKIVTLQLGNGASACAIAAGRSVDTSMGLTPTGGLVMGTRSGDVDPTLVGFVAEHENVSILEAESILTKRSGLLGVSARTNDMRDLLEAEAGGDADAALAVEMFCYRAAKYVGAYLTVLGGADAIVFGGGIGERAAPVRERICSPLAWAGLTLDESANRAADGSRQICVSAEPSGIGAWVIPVDEETIIDADVRRVVG